MKIINFMGNIDKRILVLSLARGLTFLGETLIITDDSSYKRMADEAGILDGIKILYTNEFSQTIIDDYDDGVSYSNIIFDTISFIFEAANKKIICRHKDRSLVPNNIIDTFDKVDIEGEPEVESDEVVMTAFVPKRKKFGKKNDTTNMYLDRYEEAKLRAHLITLKSSHYQWLYLCEETKNIRPLQDAEVINFLNKRLFKIFDMTEKQFEALLMRVDNGGSK